MSVCASSRERASICMFSANVSAIRAMTPRIDMLASTSESGLTGWLWS